MSLDPDDPGISRELIVYGTHEPLATDHAIQFAQGARTIIDIGSNIGYYCLLFLNSVQPRPEIIAIEPASRNFGRLRHNLELNGFLEAVKTIRAAVSDTDGEGVLHLSKESNWHTLLPADYRHDGSESVQVITLDTLCAQLNLPHVDLVRMDIEGYETVVCRGMKGMLKRYKPRLIIELHPQLTGTKPIRSLLEMLTDECGYTVDYIIDRERDYAYFPKERETLSLESLLKEDLQYRCFTVFLTHPERG